MRTSNVAVSPDALVRAARGFSCIFWGIPIALILFSGTLDFGIFDRFRMPAYVLGVCVVYVGVIFLHRIGPFSATWPGRVRRTLLVLLVEVYLAPFVYWWRQKPDELYYAANVLALILFTTWGLFLINRLAGEAGRALHDRSFFVETQLSGWIAVACLTIPAAYAVFSAVRAVRLFGAAGVDFAVAPFDLPPWIFAVALLPFTLTMAITWKAKERCLDVLKLSAKVPAPTQ